MSDTETVTITITGTNDDPVITNGPDSDSHTSNGSAFMTSGTMTVSDVDLTDVVTASVSSLVIGGNSNRSDPAAPNDAQLEAMLTVSPTTILNGSQDSASLAWNFDSDTFTFDYLGGTESIVLTYTIQAIDDDGSPLSDTETVPPR